LLLVAAITLAAVFLALGVITNAAIFTQHLATRSDTAGAADSLSVRGEVRDAVADMMERIRETSAAPTPGSLSTTVDRYSETLGYQAGTSSRVVQVDYRSHSDGTYVEDVDEAAPDGHSTFESATGATDWTVAAAAENTRALRIEVDPATLSDSEDDITDSTVDEFVVYFRNPSSDPFWRIQVGESGGDVAVNVSRYDDRAGRGGTIHVGTCTRDVSTLVVNVTAATVNGDYCEPLDELWSGPDRVGDLGYFGSTTYDIDVENGDEAEGSYRLVTDGGVDVTNTRGRLSADPWQNDAVYHAEVEYRYNGSATGYRDVIRVAPGEPDA
jgi:hypothetical protein